MKSYEEKNALVCRTAAEEGMVLLKNRNHSLPIAKSGKLAVAGIGVVRTIRGGTGSGDPFNAGNDPSIIHINQSKRFHINIMTSLIEYGYDIVNAEYMEDLAKLYDKRKENFRGSMMQTFISPEEEITEEYAEQWSKETDTILFVISRTSGEGTDRSMLKNVMVDGISYEVGDYKLSDTEIHNLQVLRKVFKKLIVLLNVGGVIDMEQVDAVGPDAVLLMGQAGQEGGAAAVRVLNGTVNPSGRLTDTWARSYDDYPASNTFAMNDGNAMEERYEEGIYVGYRYFQSFGITPRYCFGYGLSYTTFDIKFGKGTVEDGQLLIEAYVTNTGERPGAEVVQLYVSKPETKLEMPYSELIDFIKTKVLQPQETMTVHFCVDIKQLASFDESCSCSLLSEGDYVFRLGNSSDAEAVFVLENDSEIVLEKMGILLPIREELKEIHHPVYDEKQYSDLPRISYHCESYSAIDYTKLYEEELSVQEETEPKACRFEAVLADKASAEELIASLSDDEVSTFMAGIGFGGDLNASTMVGLNSKSIPGAAGETTSSLEEKYGIPKIIVADGPAGLRVRQEYDAVDDNGTVTHVNQHSTAWPVGTVLAQTFDRDLIREVGAGIADELSGIGVDFILGPGLNIHRDPLCGRNFEYYSEDPIISGEITAAMVQGIQKTNRTGACIKHFAVNNQETLRSLSDSILNQRALREIYLKGFEIAVRKAQPKSIMTSYNRINGTYAPESHDLCTKIARTEWGFEGFIMTDWNGGREPKQFLIAGNDLMMPGGENKVLKVRMEMTRIDPEFDENGQVAMPRIYYISDAREEYWNSFVPCSDGKEIFKVELGEEYHAVINEGKVYVNGELIYTHATDRVLMRGKKIGEVNPFRDPLTTELCDVSEDGKTIIYKGNWKTLLPDYRLHVNRCAVRILKTMIEMHR